MPTWPAAIKLNPGARRGENTHATTMNEQANWTDPVGKHTLELIARADRFNRWIYGRIRPYLEGSIMEIGSGIGNISVFLVRDGFSITLSDYDPAYCALLRNRFREASPVQEVLCIDLQDSDFYDTYASLREKYDTIYLVNVIEHLQEDAKAMEYCRYMLRDKGRLIILAPAYSALFSSLDRELGHFRRYNLRALESLYLGRGYKVLHKQYFNLAGVLGWLWFGKILHKKMIGRGEVSAFDRFLPLLKLADRLVGNRAGLSVILVGEKQVSNESAQT
jgi:2-polyprenyl-3-methyl-5-hydroxy-6-metoxy-1,4-benzoquinol methylase